MELFLDYLEKYDLLIELIITLLTIILSLIAVFQTKSIAKKQMQQEERIAKQQVDLQEKQIKISVYEQKNQINKALNTVFNVVYKISFYFRKYEVNGFKQKTLYDILNHFVEGVDFEDINYTLEQSRSFLNDDVYQNIMLVCNSFSSIGVNIDCLGLLKEDEDTKATLINNIHESCTEIEELKTTIQATLVNELKLV